MTHDLSSYSDRSEFTAKNVLRVCKEFHINGLLIYLLSTRTSNSLYVEACCKPQADIIQMNFIINQLKIHVLHTLLIHVIHSGVNG